MKLIKQSHEILYPQTNADWDRELQLIEFAGRTAYKSEDKITEISHTKFNESIIRRGHEAVIEFGNMVVKFITDRGISHEIVRHRLCSFLQESTRYCNYSQDKFGNEITVVSPSTWLAWPADVKVDWEDAMKRCEKDYFDMLKNGSTPQQARAVLPNSLKTEIVVKANFREWRHIFKLRAISNAAHPDMRALMTPLYEACRNLCPEIFDLGNVE
jgi:thymidylate synthase (FAD)